MVRSCKFLSIALASILACSSTSIAQQVAPRVRAQVDESELMPLRGNVPMLAQARFDRGEAQPSMQLTHIRLVLSRSAEQQAALDTFMGQLQDKSSPNYHKWLTPGQFGALYGPADSDIAAIVAWLESHGLKLEGVSTGRTNIAFSGTVTQVEEALHVSMHSFEANGEQFYSNTTDPQIPAALSAVVKGVAHLNTIKPKAHSIQGREGQINPETHRLEPFSASLRSGARPELTVGSGTSSSPYFLYMVPGDAATIYDTPNSFNANFSSGQAYTGSGVTIGIGGEALIQASTVTNYRSAFLGSATAPTIVNVDGVTMSTNTDARDEAYLDTEIAGGLAPGASIRFYTSTDLGSAINQAVNDNLVDIFSLSFGYCEQYLSTGDNQQLNSWWEQAATQGIAVAVSTGDTGSAGCDAQADSNGNATTAAQAGLAVSGYASTPFNIAVGGTDLYGLENSYSTYASTSQGTSATYFRTALKYIPESTWNNSVITNGAMAANVPWTSQSQYAQYANISSGSGGKSSCSTNTTVDTQTTYTIGTCTSGYAKPGWQRGIGVPNDGVRDLPDVSFMAGSGSEPATWLVCDDETGKNSQNQTVSMNCVQQSDGYTYFDGYGGTSTATPAFAGMLALVQQKTGGRLGQAAAELYDLYNGSHAGSIFHDTTVGNISVPCVSGSVNCVKNSAGYYFEPGYDTTAGYDLATGLGSVDVSQLVTYWGAGLGTATASLTVNPAANAINSASSLQVQIAVSGASGSPTPTGTVTLTSGNYSSGAQQLSSGSYVFTIPGYRLSGGNDVLTVAYSGDAIYAAVTDTSKSISVTQSTFTLSATNVTIAAGATSGNTSAITVTPQAGYTGTVTLTAAVAWPSGAVSKPTLTGSSVVLNVTGQSATGTVTVGSTPAAQVKMGSNAAGWFGAAGGAMLASLLLFFIPGGARRWRAMLGALLLMTAVGFAAVGCGGGSTSSTPPPAKNTPTVTVTPAKTKINTTDSLSVTVAVSGSGSTPTGTVTLSGGGYSGSAQALSSGSATIALPANAFTSTGSVTLTAAYGGDSNYNSASGSSTITVNAPATTSGAYTVTVTGTGNDPANTQATTTFTLTVQ